MYKKRKMIYSLGFMCTLAIPIVSVVSCGDDTDSEDQEQNQKKLNSITQDQVKTALSIENANSDKMASSAGIANDVNPKEINGLKGTLLKVTNWVHSDVLGEITLNVSILKSGLTTKKMDMKITGYNHDQGLIDSVTEQEIISKFVDISPSSSISPSDAQQPSDIIDNTINTVKHANVAITNWSDKDSAGEIDFTAVVSKSGYKPKNIDVTVSGYHIDTSADVDRKNLEKVNAQQIIDTLNLPTVDRNILASAAPDINAVTGIDIGGVLGVDINITNTVKTDATGKISFNAQLKKGAITTNVNGIIIGGYMVELTRANRNTLSSFNSTSKELKIFQLVTKIADATLYDIKANSVVFESNSYLQSIGAYAFQNTITSGSIIFPNELEAIGNLAFRNCSFDSIKFGTKLKTIGANAFMNFNGIANTLTSVRFPASMITIGLDAFSRYANIETITFDGVVPTSGGRQLRVWNRAFEKTPIDVIHDLPWRSWFQSFGYKVFK